MGRRRGAGPHLDLYAIRPIHRRGGILRLADLARGGNAIRSITQIIDRCGHALGLAALMRIEPDMRVVEVGNILLSPSLQRTPLATEAQYRLARYVFETLGYRRYEWRCDALNAASRRAALRFGFSFEGIFRDHMIIKGRNRDTAWFAMLEAERPARKVAFERWPAAENFAADGT